MTPPLPQPITVEGNRLMYTRAQMIDYGQACAEDAMAKIDASRMKHNASGQPKAAPSDEVNRLFKAFGMTP